MFFIVSGFSAKFCKCGNPKNNLNQQYPNIHVSNIQTTEMTGLYSFRSADYLFG